MRKGPIGHAWCPRFTGHPTHCFPCHDQRRDGANLLAGAVDPLQTQSVLCSPLISANGSYQVRQPSSQKEKSMSDSIDATVGAISQEASSAPIGFYKRRLQSMLARIFHELARPRNRRSQYLPDLNPSI